MTLSRWLRTLLLLYPTAFRDEYGAELAAVHAQRRRAAGSGAARAWLVLEIVADTVVSASACHARMFAQDARFALRTLRRSPAFAVTAIAVSALGIGATTAAFSITDHVLLRPLPFAKWRRLVNLWENPGGHAGYQNEVSPANFRDWRAMTVSFETLAAWHGQSVNLVGEGEPRRLEGAAATAELLPMLGVQPLLGRTFASEDDQAGARGALLLSFGLWQSAFGGRPDVVGRAVRLDDESYTVVGVMPPEFSYPSRETTFWTAMRLQGSAFEDRTDTYLRVLARLKPGITLEAADTELKAVAARLEREYPKDADRVSAVVVGLRGGVPWRSRMLLIALLSASCCLLVIACLNLANLLLARALVRRRELAVRAALGGGRRRLVRQLLTESALLALAGAMLGVPIGFAAMPVLASLVPSSLPVRELPPLDLRVMAAAAMLTVLTVLGFGVVPALRALRGADAGALREGARGGVGGHRERARRFLVMGEVAATVALLVLTGLLLRSMWRVEATDPGFKKAGVVTLRTTLPQPRYAQTASRARFYDRVLSDVRALPGVQAAGYTSFLPMVLRGGIWRVDVPGRPADADAENEASARYVTPGYFDALAIPLRRGRDVGVGDTATAAAVAVVSESLVRRYWPGTDGLGRKFRFGGGEYSVIGVVGDVRVRGLERTSEPQVYLSYRQVPDGDRSWYVPKDLAVRTSGDPLALAPALRRIIHAADPEQSISDLRLLADIVDDETAPRRAQLRVLAGFAVLALLLAGIGIHGLLAFAVSQRAPEIGVRMALGAARGDILRRVVGEGVASAALGVAIGLALAYGGGLALEAVLFGVTPGDAPTFLCATALGLSMTALGSLLPAVRALRISPAQVMRAE